jgi:hypothetical protein
MLAADIAAFDITRRCRPYQDMQANLLNLQKWAICTGEGFFTYPHIDGSGQLTWMLPHTGTKIWIYFTLKPTVRDQYNEPARQSRKRVKRDLATPFDTYTEALKIVHEFVEAPEVLPSLLEAHVILLQPGDLL